MIQHETIIFIHGMYGSSQGFKASYLRLRFPGMHTPDFSGSLSERIVQLETLLGESSGWTIVGSSLGGLMGAIYTCKNPERVRKLILLAPALIWPDFRENPPQPVDVPTVLYHGRYDDLIPADAVQHIAEQVFTNLAFHLVDDDHSMHRAVQEIDWDALVGV